MTKIPDGGPAFPRSDAGYSTTQDGMSLRDWIAGQVAAAAIVNAAGITEEIAKEAFPVVARLAYAMADAMLEARNK